MKINLKNMALTALFTSFASAAIAGQVTIKNDNDKPIILEVIPEDASKNFKYERQVASKQETTLNIIAEELEGKSVYDIVVRTGATVFTKDTCKGLSVNTNYLVTATNDTVGTTCVVAPAPTDYSK